MEAMLAEVENAADKRYAKKHGKAAEEKRESPAKEAAETGGAGGGDEGEASGGHAAMVDAMRKRHEQEMRDHQGAHRMATRDMFKRHADEYKGLMANMGSQGEGAQPAEPAPGGGAA